MLGLCTWTISFCCCKPPTVWHLMTATLRNEYTFCVGGHPERELWLWVRQSFRCGGKDSRADGPFSREHWEWVHSPGSPRGVEGAGADVQGGGMVRVCSTGVEGSTVDPGVRLWAIRQLFGGVFSVCKTALMQIRPITNSAQGRPSSPSAQARGMSPHTCPSVPRLVKSAVHVAQGRPSAHPPTCS